MTDRIGAHTIGFIGGGNMAEAFIGAFMRSGIAGKDAIRVSDVRAERLEELKNAFGIRVTDDNNRVFRESDILILAVKPQTMDGVLNGLASNRGNFDGGSRRLVISIAAGVPIRKIEYILYRDLDDADRAGMPIIRVMPNTPALVGEGMCGISANRYATAEDIELTRKILESVGRVGMFSEGDLDAVTALSGSGPAYVFFLAECMIDSGIRMGLSPADAVTLTMQTLKGALTLMEDRMEAPEDLRRKVTSPGGTTEAAFRVIGANRIKEIFIEAVQAARTRSVELSR